jgi:hypothetical protein
VICGGIATVVIALAWTRFFPSLVHLNRLEDLEPVVFEADTALANEWL